MTKDIEREAFEATQNTNVLFERIEYIASMDAYMPKHEFANNLMVMQSAERFNFGWSMWKSATERAEKKLEGCVVVPESEYTELKGDKEHFSNACIDWTDRAYKQRAKVEHIKNEVERFKQSGTHLDLSNFLDNLIEFATFKHDDELKDFVLIKLNEKCIYAIEQEVEQQVEASGITTDVFRLDGEKILNAMLEAARGGNE